MTLLDTRNMAGEQSRGGMRDLNRAVMNEKNAAATWPTGAGSRDNRDVRARPVVSVAMLEKDNGTERRSTLWSSFAEGSKTPSPTLFRAWENLRPLPTLQILRPRHSMSSRSHIPTFAIFTRHLSELEINGMSLSPQQCTHPLQQMKPH